MLLAHILFYLLCQGTSLSGVHTAAINSKPTCAHNFSLSLPARDSGINDPSPAASFNSNQRSIFEIVWGCLTTIFLCTWVAVHLDIPDDDQSDWNVLCHRLKMMCWTIMFPELVIAHAVRQFLEARSYYRIYKYRDSGWTMKHAHFKRMGGFRDVGHLTSEQMPAAGIQDKSKADGLSKIILVTQSLWFVVQCIGRRVKGLDLSPFEVTTIALTICTFMLSIIWWDKPFDVRKPIIRLDATVRPVSSRGSSMYFEQLDTPPSYPSVPVEEDITEGEFSYTMKSNNGWGGWGVTTGSNDDLWGTKSDTVSDSGLSRSPPRLGSPIPDTIDSDNDSRRIPSDPPPDNGLSRSPPRLGSPISDIFDSDDESGRRSPSHEISEYRLNSRIENPVADTIDSYDNWMRSTSHEIPEYGSGWGTPRLDNAISHGRRGIARNNWYCPSLSQRVLLAVVHAFTPFTSFTKLIFSYAAMILVAVARTVYRYAMTILTACRALIKFVGQVVLEISNVFFRTTRPLTRISGFSLLFEGVDKDDVVHSRVPDMVSMLQIFCIPVTGAMIFGMVHCISWNSYFPSTKERTLWRISSVSISAVMLATACAFRLAYRATTYNKYVGLGLVRLSAVTYIVARCYLLTEGLLALRDLPPSALETFNWSDFLPHVS